MVLTLVSTIVMILIGSIVIWVIAKLFSMSPPSILGCVASAVIIEVVAFIPLPFIPFIAVFIVLITIGGFKGVPAFFATMLYGLMRMAIVGGLVIFLM